MLRACSVGCKFVEIQTKCRRFIGERFNEIDPLVKVFIGELVAVSDESIGLLIRWVHTRRPAGSTIMSVIPPQESADESIVSVNHYPKITVMAFFTRMDTMQSRKTTSQKQVTIGIFADGQRTIMKARDLDRSCTEVYLLRNAESPEDKVHQTVGDGNRQIDVDPPSELYSCVNNVDHLSELCVGSYKKS